MTYRHRRAQSEVRDPIPAKRFKVRYTDDVIWVEMDRNRFFNGEDWVIYVLGVQADAAGGAWERFNLEDVSFVD